MENVSVRSMFHPKHVSFGEPDVVRRAGNVDATSIASPTEASKDAPRAIAGQWTPAVHDHLAQLLDAGLVVPNPVAVDGDHELLTFIEGVPIWSPGKRRYIGDADLHALATLLRRYHDTAV